MYISDSKETIAVCEFNCQQLVKKCQKLIFKLNFVKNNFFPSKNNSLRAYFFVKNIAFPIFDKLSAAEFTKCSGFLCIH